MNSKHNLEVFIENLFESIVDNHDISKNYHKIQKNRSDLIEELGLDINKIETKEVVNALKLSGFKYLYHNLDLEEIADVIFLHKMDDKLAKSYLQKMITGINEKNYLTNIYSYDEFYKETYGIDLNNIEKYLEIDKKNQALELKSNFATFIEYYYSTNKGKEFINNYRDKTVDGVMPKAFFEEIFEKMNQASITPTLKAKSVGVYQYQSAGAGSLDGFFVIFDDNFNMTFNVSTTASRDVSIENSSVLRHAISSKFISEAIVKEIDREIKETNRHHTLLDDKSFLKKDRADCWVQYASNDISKNIFLHRALSLHAQEENINIKTDYEKTDKESGKAIQSMIKDLNRQDPVYFLNSSLNISDKKENITAKKIKAFFKTDNDFKTNFVSDVNGLRNKKLYDESSLKREMDKLKIGMYEFKTFLQTATLKDITLKEYIKGIDKEAVETFYNDIVTRRVFAKLNQQKINHPQFLHNVEKFIINDFVLKDSSVIKDNLEFLNEADKKHLAHYLKFMLFNKNDDASNLMHITQKLKELQIDNTDTEVLKKINENYPELVEKSSDLLIIQQERLARQKAESESFEKDAIIARLMAEVENGKKNKYLKNDEIDYDSGKKAVLDLEKSIKIDNKIVDKSSIKNKLN